MEGEEPGGAIFSISPKEEDTFSQQDGDLPSPTPSASGDELHSSSEIELSADAPPILQGHVFKRSTSGISSKMGLTSFQKRYFVLYDGVLLYYEHQSSYERDKHHELKHGKRILLEDLYLTHTTTHLANHCFTLHVPHKDNRRKSYTLAMSDRRSRNIWIEMLQQQNPNLQPSINEIDGHPLKPVPSYINMIRTLPTPSPILRSKSFPQHRVHISELENYHYALHRQRNVSWTSSSRSSFSSGLLMSRSSHSSLMDSTAHSEQTDSSHSLNASSNHEHRE